MFVVFGKENCSYCRSAKKMLEQTGSDFTYHDLTELPEVRLAFKTLGHDTMPYILRDGEKIGGFDDLQKVLVEELM